MSGVYVVSDIQNMFAERTLQKDVNTCFNSAFYKKNIWR